MRKEGQKLVIKKEICVRECRGPRKKLHKPKRLIRRGPPSQKTLFLLSLIGTTNLLPEKLISRYKINTTIIQ